MRLIATLAEAATRRKRTILPDGRPLWSNHYFGTTPDFPAERDGASPPREPQAFLVEQSAGATLGTHFHLESQFQVAIAGGGRIGGHDVSAISVHYADAHNAYGPIVAGNTGLTYFTLREHGDNGAWYLPADRAAMDRKAPRRQVISRPASDDATMSRTLDGAEVLIDGTSDGLGAWIVSVSPGNVRTSRTGDGAAGNRFLITLDDALALDGRQLDRWSVAYLPSNSAALLDAPAQAGRALIVQFPRRRSQTARPTDSHEGKACSSTHRCAAT